MKTFLIVFFAVSFSAFAEDEIYTLDPVVSDGTTAESLKFDPIVPAFIGKTDGRMSTGNVAKEIANDLPFHSNSNMKPGNEVGFIGIGKGAEETDVNMLGIPVNRPQGGGADLATFPQYFWSGYSYQIGPSLGAFDPRGVGGSLTLRLWTQDTLGTESMRASAFYSSRDLQQFSIGKSAKRYSILAGMTTDSVVGPGLSFSAIPLESAQTKVTTHLIYSDTNAKNFASERSGASSGEQHTYRLIPVLQVDQKFAENVKFKTSFFYDLSYVRYTDPSNAAARQIKKVDQYGNESAFIMNDTRIGFGARHVAYKRSVQNSLGTFPSENVLNIQASHGFRNQYGSGSTLLLEPMLGGYAVTRNGFYPTGSIGLRNETKVGDSKQGQFIRIGMTKRFPSLLDRYYELQQAIGPNTTLRAFPNPDLKPESVRSTEAGADFAQGNQRGQITFFARDYKHARYTRSFIVQPFPTIIGYQLMNAGDAYVYGATGSHDLKLLPVFDIGTRLTYQKSKIQDMHAEFPYSPRWVGILKLDLHDPNQKYGIEAVAKKATNFVAYSETSGNPAGIPGYFYLDLFARMTVQQFTLVAGVENIFDRAIQYRLASPDEGREFSASVTANF